MLFEVVGADVVTGFNARRGAHLGKKSDQHRHGSELAGSGVPVFVIKRARMGGKRSVGCILLRDMGINRDAAVVGRAAAKTEKVAGAVNQEHRVGIGDDGG